MVRKPASGGITGGTGGFLAPISHMNGGKAQICSALTVSILVSSNSIARSSMRSLRSTSPLVRLRRGRFNLRSILKLFFVQFCFAEFRQGLRDDSRDPARRSAQPLLGNRRRSSVRLRPLSLQSEASVKLLPSLNTRDRAVSRRSFRTDLVHNAKSSARLRPSYAGAGLKSA